MALSYHQWMLAVLITVMVTALLVAYGSKPRTRQYKLTGTTLTVDETSYDLTRFDRSVREDPWMNDSSIGSGATLLLLPKARFGVRSACSSPTTTPRTKPSPLRSANRFRPQTMAAIKASFECWIKWPAGCSYRSMRSVIGKSACPKLSSENRYEPILKADLVSRACRPICRKRNTVPIETPTAHAVRQTDSIAVDGKTSCGSPEVDCVQDIQESPIRNPVAAKSISSCTLESSRRSFCKRLPVVIRPVEAEAVRNRVESKTGGIAIKYPRRVVHDKPSAFLPSGIDRWSIPTLASDRDFCSERIEISP